MGWLPWLLELYGQPWSHEETNMFLVLNKNSNVNYPVYPIGRLESGVHFDPISDNLEPRLAGIKKANMATRTLSV